MKNIKEIIKNIFMIILTVAALAIPELGFVTLMWHWEFFAVAIIFALNIPTINLLLLILLCKKMQKSVPYILCALLAPSIFAIYLYKMLIPQLFLP